jgi:hypothetical protein
VDVMEILGDRIEFGREGHSGFPRQALVIPEFQQFSEVVHIGVVKKMLAIWPFVGYIKTLCFKGDSTYGKSL